MSEEISKLEQEKQKAEEKEEEKGARKREIIKNIAIIFLSIMLVLTFFSNTIMNFSLPQVSTELVSSGTIKTQVRGQGVVETVDPYNLTVKETRTIKAVHVKEGDEVKLTKVTSMMGNNGALSFGVFGSSAGEPGGVWVSPSG